MQELIEQVRGKFEKSNGAGSFFEVQLGAGSNPAAVSDAIRTEAKTRGLKVAVSAIAGSADRYLVELI